MFVILFRVLQVLDIRCLHPHREQDPSTSLGPGCGRSQPSTRKVSAQSVFVSLWQPIQCHLPGKDWCLLHFASREGTLAHLQLSSCGLEKKWSWYWHKSYIWSDKMNDADKKGTVTIFAFRLDKRPLYSWTEDFDAALNMLHYVP